MDGSAVKESACIAGDLGSIPGLGRSPGDRKGYPLQYSGLENSMDWIVQGVTKSRTWLSDYHFTKVCLNKEERQKVKQLLLSCWVNKKEIHVIGKNEKKNLIKNVSQIPNQLGVFVNLRRSWNTKERAELCRDISERLRSGLLGLCKFCLGT